MKTAGVEADDITVYLVRVVEGKTVLYVPRSSLATGAPPKAPAFFNPYAKLNRDLSVVAYRVVAGGMASRVVFADALAGVGARGVRVAVEVAEVDVVVINDLNPLAVRMAETSAIENKVEGKCRFSIQDICHFLIGHSTPDSRFDIVDLDPFGSPAPYLDCALRSVKSGGLLSATATDTAVLCGLYPKVSYRRYYGYSLRTEYCHELGIRILLGALAHHAMRLDLGVKPIFAHSTRNYIRVYATVETGAGKAGETYEQMGYIGHCFKCRFRGVYVKPDAKCLECGSPLRYAGPLWVGEIYERSFLQRLAEECERSSFKQGSKIAALALQEVGMPLTYFVSDDIADVENVATPSTTSLLEALRGAGYRAARTALHPKGLKTDAPAKIFRGILKSLSTRGARSPVA